MKNHIVYPVSVGYTIYGKLKTGRLTVSRDTQYAHCIEIMAADDQGECSNIAAVGIYV